MTRYGMTINLDRCVGCYACSVACALHNGLPKDVRWSGVKKAESGTFPKVEAIALPTLCMQCSKPLCVAACPTGASVQNDNGIITVDASICIGCDSCVAACPYGARSKVNAVESNHAEGGPTAYESHVFVTQVPETMSKCTFCADRLENDEQPACVATCQAKARSFGDLDDATSDVAKQAKSDKAQTLLAAEGTEPAVYYLYSGSIDLDKAFTA